jgi:hypothetical protein
MDVSARKLPPPALDDQALTVATSHHMQAIEKEVDALYVFKDSFHHQDVKVKQVRRKILRTTGCNHQALTVHAIAGSSSLFVDQDTRNAGAAHRTTSQPRHG